MFKFKNFLKWLMLLLHISDVWSKRVARIVDGGPDEIASVPSLVQLYENGVFRCGGTLVSEYFVVTAAHCAENRKPSGIRVKAGASTLIEGGIKGNVSKIFIPKAWNMSISFNMDVAMLKLTEPLKGALIQPTDICTKQGKHGDVVRTYGWGKQRVDLYYNPNQLQSVDLFVVDNKKCGEMYRSEANITNTMFCAAAPGKSACIGDSGGPVYVNGKFCALTSFSYGCATPGYPGVYTNLTNPKVRKFIKSAMKH